MVSVNKNLILLTKLKRTIQYYSTEIGLQTYNRKPSELIKTDSDWKLRRAENMVRECRDKCLELIKELEKCT